MFGLGAMVVEFLLGLFIEGGIQIEEALQERGINLENIVLIGLAVAIVLCVVACCVGVVIVFVLGYTGQ